MLKGFKDFVLRGNVVDLAVAVVIGIAFGELVKSFTGHIIEPILNSIATGDSAGFGFFIRDGRGSTYVDIAAVFIAVLNFIIIAAVVYFIVVVPINAVMARRRRGEEPAVESPSEDIVLLQEIRDLLQQRSV